VAVLAFLMNCSIADLALVSYAATGLPASGLHHAERLALGIHHHDRGTHARLMHQNQQRYQSETQAAARD
jgi:hypothetical protein